MVGPFKPSFKPVPSFDMLRSIKPVCSFDMAGPFELVG